MIYIFLNVIYIKLSIIVIKNGDLVWFVNNKEILVDRLLNSKLNYSDVTTNGYDYNEPNFACKIYDTNKSNWKMV